ncbi:hypothetical protein MATL_G00102630 [Megalops atlanticus]|uniref:Gypsy retrotransposon integrase-like protein 1 n=1 Tax=Megalops atlanticus TaxID=7932 RepID=A0A9D3T8R2_MEGAT|nr:hypothetical protein MATL_G00102630 [Megalops atlanticus]
MRGESLAVSPTRMRAGSSSSDATPDFDVSKHIRLVPPFRETEVDSYFNAFERIAATLHWPRDLWSPLLQCKLVGKAQEVCAALSIEESLDYDVVKATVLRAYELVPEAYRQKFRNHVKTTNQTFVEFARDKASLFDKWLHACKVSDFDRLKELLLLEEFKNCLPERIVYLNEQKVTSVAQAAVLADEYVLTHKTVFSVPPHREATQPRNLDRSFRSLKTVHTNPSPTKDIRECFYCHEIGHLIAVCPVLQKKSQSKQSGPSTKSVGLIEATTSLPLPALDSDVDTGYNPFISTGTVSLSGKEEDQVFITILRDTGATQSFILEDVLPFSNETYCGVDVLVQGIELGTVRVPLHSLRLQSTLVSGPVKVGLRSKLPVTGIDLILGNDLAGDKVYPLPEVIDRPDLVSSLSHSLDSVHDSSSVFSACAVTRAQARKFGDMVDLSSTLMASPSDDSDICPVTSSSEGDKADTDAQSLLYIQPDLQLPISTDRLIAEQKSDPSLATCRASAVAKEAITEQAVAYFVDHGILMRKWSAPPSREFDWNSTYQIVVPMQYRVHVLSLAHDHPFAGHLCVTKTYNRILRHFFWSGLKADVVKYCRS